jgi:hypothetical protein
MIEAQMAANQNSTRTLLAIIAFAFCGVCCGGPTLLYIVVSRDIVARREAPATPEPLAAGELLEWFQNNRPTQPFVWHDKTRDKVDFRGTVKEVNIGSELRIASTSDKFRTRVQDLKPRYGEVYQKKWGKSSAGIPRRAR